MIIIIAITRTIQKYIEGHLLGNDHLAMRRGGTVALAIYVRKLSTKKEKGRKRKKTVNDVKKTMHGLYEL